ncbi:hypothetical protein [Pseudactinotalea sp.]|uniref:hypothetical protein n=1 Tax=Pseudactinotalea sp. TaxID=1926260 RepID=UPI003B3A171E
MKQDLTAAERQARTQRRRAAWTLVLLAPVCAELTFTAVAVPFTWLLTPLLMVMYGAGVLLVREVVARTGAGWPGLVLMGLAYQLAEDGLGLQALTSPDMYGAADWGWRALGANWSYWASQIGVHVVLSVLVPVMLTNILFPAQRDRPYLRTPGLIVTGALAIVGVMGLRVVISATEDPGYVTPWGWLLAYVAAIAVLTVLTVRVAPHLAGRPARISPAPRPPVVGISLAVVTVVFLVLLLPPGLGPTSALGAFLPLPILVAIAVLVGLGSAWQVERWARAQGWSDRHRIWLAGGILVGHTAFMMPASASAVLTGAITIAVEVALLVVLARYVARRRGEGAVRSR